MALESIANFFAPHTINNFLKNDFGKSFLHIKAKEDKFSHLLTWADLNHLLKYQRLDSPRIRLSKDGKNLPATEFIRYTPARRGGDIPKLIPSRLIKEIKQGATLIIDAIDEIHGPVSRLAEVLELSFYDSFQANVYIGWGEINGFDLHWDDHDVFIAQVYGKKDWKIYPPTRLHPLYRDIDTNQEPPTTPIWEETLTAGDLLYIPRGWWHIANPINEPTIHITFGLNRRNGIDFLSWISKKLLDFEIFRRDLPRFASIEEQNNHLQELKEVLINNIDNNTLTEYYKETDSHSLARPFFSFPLAAKDNVFDQIKDAKLKLLTPREVVLETNNEHTIVILKANGKELNFSYKALKILDYITKKRTLFLSELDTFINEDLDRNTINLFIEELIAEGIIGIIEYQKINS